MTWGTASWTTHHLTLYLGHTKNDPLAQHPNYTIQAPRLAHMLAYTYTTVLNSPPLDTPVIPYTPQELNHCLTLALQHLNSQSPPLYPIPRGTHITWHSHRHGHATDAAIANTPLPTLIKQGRWHTRAACSLYLYFQAPTFWPSHTPTQPTYLAW